MGQACDEPHVKPCMPMQAVVTLNQLTAQGDREQFSSEAEWETLTSLIEDDRRQQARGHVFAVHSCRYTM